MKSVVDLDGSLLPEEEASIPVTSTALLYGYGLFETIRVENSYPLFWEEHLLRLYQSASRIDLKPQPSKGELGRRIKELIEASQLELGAVRINLTPEHYFIIPRQGIPYKKNDYREGFEAITLNYRRPERGLVPTIKSLSFLENLLGRKEAQRKGVQEGIFLNHEGNISEGSMSNIFLRGEQGWITPALDQGLLPGITRALILKLFSGLKVPYQESKGLKPKQLLTAREAFLSGSLMEIMPLVKYDGQQIGNGRPGPETIRLRDEYCQMKKEELNSINTRMV